MPCSLEISVMEKTSSLMCLASMSCWMKEGMLLSICERLGDGASPMSAPEGPKVSRDCRRGLQCEKEMPWVTLMVGRRMLSAGS